MEYEIVRESSYMRLQESVEKMINLGFRPVGGVAVSVAAYEVELFYQAMVKEKSLNSK